MFTNQNKEGQTHGKRSLTTASCQGLDEVVAALRAEEQRAEQRVEQQSLGLQPRVDANSARRATKSAATRITSM